MRFGPSALCLVFLIVSVPAPAQQRGEVELPLETYDRLRADVRARRAPPSPKPEDVASCRLVSAVVSVDLERRSASWEAVFEAVSTGEEPPKVPLVHGAASVVRSTVEPGTAPLSANPKGVHLEPTAAGRWRVVLSGESAASGADEVAGLRFPLPALASVPAAFDVVLPAGAIATLDPGAVLPAAGRPDRRRAVIHPGASAVSLLVKRPRREDSGRAVADGTLTLVARVAEDTVRTEMRLRLVVRKGRLASRPVVFPGASLVATGGRVLVTGPDEAGRTELKFEPPVAAGGEAVASLTFLSRRDPAATSLEPPLPALAFGPEERVSTDLSVVFEGGLVAEPLAEEDWTPRPGMTIGEGDDVVLAWTARVRTPRAPRLALRRLQALSAASALARLDLTAYVASDGAARTLLRADVRTRGRSALGIRVPEGAVLLAARVDGAPAAVSRPTPGRLEVSLPSEAGRSRLEILVATRVASPRAGSTLSLDAVAPEEPAERVAWTVVLPAGLGVVEEGKRLPATPEPAAATRSSETPESDREAERVARDLAAADRAAAGAVAWSASPELPPAPASFRGDFVDVGGAVPPLVLTLVARPEKEGWF